MMLILRAVQLLKTFLEPIRDGLEQTGINQQKEKLIVSSMELVLAVIMAYQKDSLMGKCLKQIH